MLLVLAFTISAGLYAQQPTLTGRVLDSTNALLPGVTVEATPAGGGTVQTTVTGPDGAYALELPPGTYDIAFQLINFATSVRRGLVIGTGSAARADATLYLSSSADVVVTAKQTFRNLADLNEPVNDLIGIADAATQGVVTAKEIERRPFQRGSASTQPPAIRRSASPHSCGRAARRSACAPHPSRSCI